MKGASFSFFVVFLRLIMKRLLLIPIIILTVAQGLFAQTNRLYNQTADGPRTINRDPNENPNDTTTVDSETIPIGIRMWTVDWLGNMHPTEVDTLRHQFQNIQLTDGMNGHYNYLGNMGSPRLSRIFFDRKEPSQFLFTDPYDFFLIRTEDFHFINTKSPFTNLSYYSAGNQTDGEDRFRSYFGVNANRRLSFGFTFDYLYGRGMYNDQATSLFNGTLFSSYLGDRYNMNFIFSKNHMKMAENGGIEDDIYITNPEDLPNTYNPSDIPTILDKTWNRNDNYYLFLTQRYNLGFHKEPIDTAQHYMDFVPVTSFIHTLKIQNYKRKYIAYDTPDNYYLHNYLPGDSTLDITRNSSIKNTFAIALHEGFNKWAKAGLTGFVSYEIRKFELPDTVESSASQFTKKYTENILSVGGELSKRMGNTLHYTIKGETALTGEDAGQFDIDGKVDLNFRLFKDTIQLAAHAFTKRITPSFYFRHYHSQHFWWNNDDLAKELRSRIEGEFTSKKWKTNLRVGVENIKNYTYFANASVPYTPVDDNGTPQETIYKNNVAVRQCSDNIQVLSAILKQDFKFGILHLDNEIAYQKSSNEDVLPLPKLSLYHNLYLDFKLAKKVLSVELGADVRYFTKYYAPDYSPAMGQFYVQNPDNRIEIGNYPIVNVYANLHLKHTRIYVMLSHVNEGTGKSNYFLVPHYPINPMVFKWGISWNFFN